MYHNQSVVVALFENLCGVELSPGGMAGEDNDAIEQKIWEKKSKDLGGAIQDDWKRQAIDSAKKRAAAQNVDYPTFANLVRAFLHLKSHDTSKAYALVQECIMLRCKQLA